MNNKLKQGYGVYVFFLYKPNRKVENAPHRKNYTILNSKHRRRLAKFRNSVERVCYISAIHDRAH